ncbi:uncharacterized protein LOC104895876 isoform X2 [Beta vulgaris subsp. vulgaris]|uniref:uncharacterized protein LOC104895876 isoform X2 n=1 Tax=Beta vulgaris subsp. vulgaris TaxID=3555 RepID=UPI002036B6DD|nr:uncharacterized protein LOC104895876 isoform X2 [Beta vulgaris subsp. vulgaris]
MPLLDIAIPQSSFQNYLEQSRVQPSIFCNIHNSCLLQHEDRWASFRKAFQNSRNLNFNSSHFHKKSHRKFLVKAVATLEPKCSVESKDAEKQSNVLSITIESHGDSEELDEREKLRRIRISKANKGNTPWNKGRKHSPETRQRIKERTRLAMQNPKVKMKLANIGHAQSQETREKIAAGVRIGWQKRREKLLVQETCLFDWQHMIAEAARKGLEDEEELQWDSYEIINEKLQQEWLASIEYRKLTPRTKGSKRAPKSLQQRRKIAEAIAAKWADPEYRSRVTSGLAKYHGIQEGAERKVRKKSQSPRTPKKKISTAEGSTASEIKGKTQQPKLKKRTTPKYKDPLANSKLEMLKNLRAQRLASEAMKNEALERAKLLIAEAEKAAKALEIAATRSPVARASLIEARKLILEATQSIESIENEQITSVDDLTLGPQNHAQKNEHPLTNGGSVQKSDGQNPDSSVYKMPMLEELDMNHHKGVNGTSTGYVQRTRSQHPDIDYYKIPMLEDMNVNHPLPRQVGGYEFSKLDIGSFMGKSELRELIDQQLLHELNGATKLNGISSHDHITKLQNHEEQVPPASAETVTKKWVCGRLVEIGEGE